MGEVGKLFLKRGKAEQKQSDISTWGLEELGHKETKDKGKAEGGKGCLNNFIKDIDCSAKKVRFYSLSNGESLRHLEQESSFSNIHFGMESIQH